MPKYVIEREIPGVGKMSGDEFMDVARRSNLALAEVGGGVQWVHSYVVDNKTYCIYIAPSERLIREHARLSGFPANRIVEVKAVIDPTTAER